MQEVADFCEEVEDEHGNKALPPLELTIAWQVERWGAVSVFGLSPVPARLLKRMAVASNIYCAFESYKAGSHRLADWAKANPAHAQIVTEIRELRLSNA